MFVYLWDDNKISTSTMILHRKKVSEREASRQCLDRVRHQVNERDRMEKDQMTLKVQDIHTNTG